MNISHPITIWRLSAHTQHDASDTHHEGVLIALCLPAQAFGTPDKALGETLRVEVPLGAFYPRSRAGQSHACALSSFSCVWS